MNDVKPYQPKHSIRLVTAASLFDGHDASINIMRRILQSSGAEVIHLGHDRSAEEVVNTAIEEDANGIALTSYQGGHLEYFKYMRDLLVEKGAGHIQIFGGGGGTILPNEIEELQAYGICRIYHPDDGRSMGLQGMINDLLEACDFPLGGQAKLGDLKDSGQIARLISCAENFPAHYQTMRDAVQKRADKSHAPVLGITGTGGAGKSSLVDEMVRRFLSDQPGKRIALISVDPSKRRTGGALLGDRIRMNSINHPDVYMRSLATRQSNLALSRHVSDALRILQAANFDLIILETSGIGQSDTEILEHSDVSLYVMTPEYGAATQLEKIDMLDFADLIALNKFDKRGALDGLRDVKKQVQRNRNAFDVDPDTMPVYGTMASQFNDPGANQLYRAIMDELVEKAKADHLVSQFVVSDAMSEKVYIIPPKRTRYLSEIAESIRSYNDWVVTQSDTADALYSLRQSAQTLADSPLEDKDRLIKQLDEAFALRKRDLDPYNWDLIAAWSDVRASYKAELYTYTVRGKDIKLPTHSKSLSGNAIPKVVTPSFRSWGDILRWQLQENVPGSFPYTSGLFPFKRQGEDPTRMFAGEGSPERTNKRFHYVSIGMPAKRLSTAFDSVTLYGHDPDRRPDIYGKIGNAGVSVCCMDDAKKLYSGFDLCSETTSVSMTINGPASLLLGFFMNAAIDQQCEKHSVANGLEKQVEA
ncbi:MAG: methylmalonyl-CoA mutase family protein, partial [Schleiferiaceae bacterium]|nr:methylmalonyl-CoA mutase family protein [Schleiferiaceae bacterium]